MADEGLHSDKEARTGATAAGMLMRERGASTSLRPWPVARRTTGSEVVRRWGPDCSLTRPARAAAPAGSVKMPVRLARRAWAARISSSVTVRVSPRLSRMARRAPCALLGQVTEMESARVVGLGASEYWPVSTYRWMAVSYTHLRAHETGSYLV